MRYDDDDDDVIRLPFGLSGDNVSYQPFFTPAYFRHNRGKRRDLTNFNLGTRNSSPFYTSEAVDDYQGSGIRVMQLPQGVMLYKGMPGECASIYDSSDVRNSFSRTMSWFGDFRTALRYAMKAKNKAAAYGTFVYRTTREIRLLDLMDHATLESIYSRMKAMAANGDEFMRRGLTALAVATGYGVDVATQVALAEKHYWHRPRGRPMQKDHRVRVDGQTFGAEKDSLNRMSLKSSDAVLVEVLKHLVPSLDGYYALSVPSLYHFHSQFHPEVCIFESYEALARMPDFRVDRCTGGIDKYAPLLKDYARKLDTVIEGMMGKAARRSREGMPSGMENWTPEYDGGAGVSVATSKTTLLGRRTSVAPTTVARRRATAAHPTRMQASAEDVARPLRGEDVKIMQGSKTASSYVRQALAYMDEDAYEGDDDVDIYRNPSSVDEVLALKRFAYCGDTAYLDTYCRGTHTPTRLPRPTGRGTSGTVVHPVRGASSFRGADGGSGGLRRGRSSGKMANA